MMPDIRPELSLKNKYYLPKHRYYELKHFCLQYPIWKKAVYSLDGLSRSTDYISISKQRSMSDPVLKAVLARDYYKKRMDMVEKACRDASKDLSKYLLIAVTEERPFNYLQMKLEIPCTRSEYYEYYRKFFWILNLIRE